MEQARQNTLSGHDSSEEYNSEQLDLLAIFFTVVKILFVSGNIPAISPLVDIIGILRLFNLIIFRTSKR